MRDDDRDYQNQMERYEKGITMYNKMTSGRSEIYMNNLYVLSWSRKDELHVLSMTDNAQVSYEDMKVFMCCGALPSELRN